MSGADIILREVLEEITPTPEERAYLFSVYEKIKRVLENYLRSSGVEAEVTLQGSVAHDTWLKGDRDLDIFVLFPESTDIDYLKKKGFELLLEAAREIGKVEVKYAEHPYVHLVVGDVEADIVPAYKLSSPERIKTAVDRTPFHTRYVVEHLKEGLNNDVRLLKKFMKSINVYGAEVKTRGFSGYAVELLVIAYRGFMNTLEAVSRWSIPVLVNTIGDEKEFDRIIKFLKKKYPDSVIYMPDPVDYYRNVTASVSLEKLMKFILAARCFLRKPSRSFFSTFDEKAQNESRIIELIDKRCIVAIEIEASENLPPEVIWGEADRIRDRCVKFLNNHDFKVYNSMAWTDEKKKAVILIELEDCQRPVFKLYEGPSVLEFERALDFVSKHIGKSVKIWVDRKGRLVSISQRKYREVLELLNLKPEEYLVSPHFRGCKPVVYRVTSSLVKNSLPPYLREFIRRVDNWLLECIA
ncbi:CCA tRNA nucleotidyltransferase [Thermogladius sp. 4427co]|uniref:CCA tRNA nucleotidyltransferase n=1 Tax=Thermogladius sp. 4427co TaxID=3450718 RepID=UPI003F79EC67